MLTGHCGELHAALRRTFPSWDCTLHGDHVRMSYGRARSTYQPPRRTPDWPELLAALSGACAQRGFHRHPPLPMTGLGDSDLTFSAVQALDPYLKHGHHHVHAHGFLPQPAVRFTGRRDEDCTLLPGYATSFVNASIVQPIGTVEDHAELIDSWVGVLSSLGFHAFHLSITGHISIWHRPPVSGITLRIRHANRALGDAVLLWNQAEPTRLATDIGTGLERLRWFQTRRSWPETVYGDQARYADPRTLDAIRTATLLIGTGITPAARGPGSAVRRLVRPETEHVSGLGISRIVRQTHAFWSMVTPLLVPWPDICRILETETA